MSLAALALAASIAAGPVDAEYRAALDLLYDGSSDTALARLSALSARHPDDPVGPYLQALALAWKIEERPESRDLDAVLRRRADGAIASADARLAVNPQDARARFARGAAHGVKSRLALFRVERREAAREAVRMREDLLEARRLDPEDTDTLFGLGLYDYYADVLPRVAKLVRFLLGMPGGDRERGLKEIFAARDGSLFHAAEVRAQLYEIFAFYEKDADAAQVELEGLHRRYPDSPLWALKLAEHRRERMGSYRAAAAAAREVLTAAESGHPNFSQVAAAMARLSLGRSLLLDLRLSEAEDVLRAACRTPRPGGRGSEAHYLLGEALELQGRRDEAVAHYRLAAKSADRDLRARADRALERPRAHDEVLALRRLAEARRLRERDDLETAAERYRQAHALWPGCREAQLGVAESDLADGRVDAARELVEADAAGSALGDPPWTEAWRELLRAKVFDAADSRREAVDLYNQVLKHPMGRPELRREAAAGLRRAWRPPSGASPAPERLDYYR